MNNIHLGWTSHQIEHIVRQTNRKQELEILRIIGAHLELLFLRVFALPKASSTGLDYQTEGKKR